VQQNQKEKSLEAGKDGYFSLFPQPEQTFWSSLTGRLQFGQVRPPPP
jgi:hypothetical protein